MKKNLFLFLSLLFSHMVLGHAGDCSRVYSFNTQKKLVGLELVLNQFDDRSLQILTYLNKMDIQATVFFSARPHFFLGSNDTKNMVVKVLKEAAKVYGRMELGNATYSGDDLTRVASRQYNEVPHFNTMNAAQKIQAEIDTNWYWIASIFKNHSINMPAYTFIHAPNGGVNFEVERSVKAKGHSIVLYDIDADDFYEIAPPKAPNMIQKIQQRIRPGSLVKISTSNPHVFSIISGLTERLTEEGYQFGKISDFFRLEQCQLNAVSLNSVNGPSPITPSPIDTRPPVITNPNPPTTSNGSWYIKAGSFKNISNAYPTITKLKNGLGSIAKIYTHKTGSYYRLYVGGTFSSASEATNKALQRVKKIVPDAFVKQLNGSEMRELVQR
jgi:hypothetical protein